MKKKILIIILALLLAVCGVSTYFYIQNTQVSEENKKVYETAAEQVLTTEEISEPSATEAAANPYTDITVSGTDGTDGSSQGYTTTFSSDDNPDMVGWIKIDGTSINYPVMQTPDVPDYYLNHDFYRNESVYGCPYVQANCDVNAPSDNVIIYGHHMNDGSMFAGLESFRSEDFYSSHKTISFNTLTEEASYEILAVFAVSVDETDESSFKYYEFVNAYDSEHFSEFVSICKSLSFYDTGVSAEYGDKLLTLSTCEYTHSNGRLVVVAKKT